MALMTVVSGAVRALRYGARVLRRDLLFSVPVLLSIALVVGANSTVFSVVDALLLQIVPFEQPDRLVSLGSLHASPDGKPQPSAVSPRDLVAWREASRSYSDLAGVYPRNFNLASVADGSGSGGEDLEPERVLGALVSPQFFRVLRIEAALGRTFVAEEEQPGRERVAILSDRLWKRRFAADAGIVGKSVSIDGATARIVGVMPPGFRYPDDSEIWGPLLIEPAVATFDWHYVEPIARLREGVHPSQAASELKAIAHRLEEQAPQTNKGWSATVEPLAQRLVGDLRPRLLALTAGVGFLLLIACANIANLLLVRNTARSKQMAVRSALGSSKSQLVGLVLGEGLLLALVGGAVGLVLTFFTARLISRLPLGVPALRDVSLNFSVIGFTVAVALAAGLLFSLAPALRLLRMDPQPYLKDGSRGSTPGSRGHRLQGVFVVLQVAVALVLLSSAALLFQSLNALRRVDPGFDPKGLLTLRVSLPESRYTGNKERAQFADEIVRRLGGLPGVRSAALTTALPVGDRDVDFSASFSIEGRIPANPSDKFVAAVRRVSPGYFRTLGMPLVAGRGFEETDRIDAAGVVVVSQMMAQRYWPGESPVNKRIKLGDYNSSNPWLTVVGVVGDVRDDGLSKEIEPIWYRPYAQHENKSARYLALVVKGDVDPASLLQPVRREVRAQDGVLPVYNIATMEQILADSLAQQRVLSQVFGGLAILGLAIAAIGLYGVMSYVVHQRRQEIGIRMAMGARPGNVLSMVLHQGMLLTGLGLLLGAGVMILLRRPLSAVLFGIKATDLATMGLIALLLGLVALVANFIPARRALRVHPVTALRQG